MSWERVLPLKKEELEVVSRRRPLGELRSRVRDLPRPRPIEPLLQPITRPLEPSPVPGGQLLVPVAAPVLDFGDASPFSIEALVAAELASRARPELTRPPVIPLVPELKRVPVPQGGPRLPIERQPAAVELFGPVLACQPRAAAVWTDRFYYQGQPEDLAAVRRWFEERRDEVPAPALVRADLVIDPYQVFETVALGGDGLVIVAAAVTRNQLEDLLGWSEELGLEALVYLCDAADADRALAARATRFAIGQGDLFDAEDRGEPGAGWLRELSRELPREAVRVSWGGVRTLADADARAAAGATALVAGRGYLAVREAMARREEG